MEPTTFKKASIILPTYCPDEEVAEYLKEFIYSLTNHTARSSYELIVVENGSYTPELEKIADRYIYFKDPIGYARAVNIGLAVANEDHIVIMNNDLIVGPKWLEDMVSVYEGGTLAPLGYPYPQPSQDNIMEDSHWFSLVLMDRNTFTKVGYLDHQLPYRFHDQDYSIRVKKAGLPVRRTTIVSVDHINSATYNKMDRNEDPEERQIMINRYGCATFEEYVALNK